MFQEQNGLVQGCPTFLLTVENNDKSVLTMQSKASATRSKHLNIQNYKNLNKSKSVQWAHVIHDDFYRDKLIPIFG